MNEEEKFPIIVDGVEKEATLITILEVQDRKFAIYSIETQNGDSDIMYSEIITDEEGIDTLVDVDDEQIREQIVKAINSIFE